MWTEGRKTNARWVFLNWSSLWVMEASRFCLLKSSEELERMFLRIVCLREKSENFVTGSGSLWLRFLHRYIHLCEWYRFPQLSQVSSALEKAWWGQWEILSEAKANCHHFMAEDGELRRCEARRQTWAWLSGDGEGIYTKSAEFQSPCYFSSLKQSRQAAENYHSHFRLKNQIQASGCSQSPASYSLLCYTRHILTSTSISDVFLCT